MTILSAQDAANLAQAVYSVLPATSSADAVSLAQRETVFASCLPPGPSNSPRLSPGIKPKSGLMGRSGAVIKKDTGFGLICERSDAGRELIVVFRGSQTNSDWLSNATIAMEAGPAGSTVHVGFNGIYKSLRDELGREIAAARPEAVHFVGHSLGGALASLAAMDFIAGGQVPGYLYTFGAPRVGALGTASVLSRNLKAASVKRVYALSDPVPMLPLFPFFHFGPGSTGIPDAFSHFSSDAHKMKTCYIPNMPETGWPPALALPNKSDPAYWLDQAVAAGSLRKGFSYLCLSVALSHIMTALSAVFGGLSLGMTVLDRIAEVLAKGVRLGAAVAENVLKFVKAAMAVVGRAAVATAVTAADLTVTFLNWVLEILLLPVRSAGQMASRLLG